MTGVKEIVLPDTITTIGPSVFRGCADLEKINIPVSVSEIQYSAFRNCIKLVSADIPENVEYIGESAFENCSSLSEIIIPDNVHDVGKCAFKGCSAAKTAYIGNGIRTISASEYDNYGIGYEAFNGCYALKELTMPALMTSYTSDTNGYCTLSVIDLFEENGYDTSEKSTAALNEYSLEKITVTSGTVILDHEFEYMTGVKEIALPDTITSVECNAFNGCSDLSDVYYNDTKSKWDTVEISEGNEPLKNAAIHFKGEKRIVGTDETDPKVLEPLRECGDIDCSGETDLADLLNLSMYLLNDIDITEGSLIYADMTKDGEVDITDLAALRQVIMGEVLNY